jgi:glutamine amidotransferase
MGNVASVSKSIKKLGHETIITDDHIEIANSDFIILPGVGSFKIAMENLHKRGLVNLLTDQVINKKKPFLGICLGMQLMADFGTEPVLTPGFGWIKGNVIKISSIDELRVPHLGWNNVYTVNNDEIYNEFNNKDFYFIHSYHFRPKEEKYILMKVKYSFDIVAAIRKDNIHGMQFHPEKSQEFGLKLLQNILNSYA